MMDHYEILWAFCEASAWAENVEVVYQRIVDTASRCFEADNVSIHLVDLDDEHFVRRASHSSADVAKDYPSALAVSFGRLRMLFESHDLIIMDYLNPNDQDVIPPESIEEGYMSALSIPLYIGSGSIGMLSLAFKRPLPFDEDDLEFLKHLGRALGVLVDRVRLSKKDLELQMLKERKRLSSEIHDNIAQLISAIGIKADTAIECREEGDMEALENELDGLAEMTRRVTKMLRAEMLTLRTSLDEEGDIAAGIVDLLTDFHDRWGIEVNVENECAGRVVTADYVQLQLVRIVNEALQNVLRHARANRVDARLLIKDKVFAVSVKDDGVGFNITDVAPERLGLRIMHERALSAGGTLTIRSDSAGTEVYVEVPALIM